jgi:hypothetical protein
MTISICYFLATIPLASAMIWKRRAFLQRGQRTQWVLAGVAIGAFAAAVALIMMTM